MKTQDVKYLDTKSRSEAKVLMQRHSRLSEAWSGPSNPLHGWPVLRNATAVLTLCALLSAWLLPNPVPCRKLRASRRVCTS